MQTIRIAIAAMAVAIVAGPAAAGEILWDHFGVPHIYAASIPEAARGMGRAEMTNHAEQLLLNIATARGRFAEYFGSGPGGSFAASDVRIHTLGIPARANAWWEASSPRQKAILQGFADGANRWAADHPDQIAADIRGILPIQPTDALALSQWTVQFGFMSREAFALVADWMRTGTAKRREMSPAGSNAWAVAPTRSADGHAMMIGNPHLAWATSAPVGPDPAALFNPQQGMLQWMEQHIVIRDPRKQHLNLSGGAFLGVPHLTIGFTDRLAWSHTVNWLRAADVFEVTLDGDRYLYGGKMQRLDQRQDSIRICDLGTPCRTQAFTVASTIHGPIVARKDGKALAFRVTGLDASAIVDQYWDMALAQSLPAFEKAASRLQMPYFNIVYADRDGHIMYAFGGQAPRRKGGNYADWAHILDGSDPRLVSTATLAWSELPRLIDPSSGFVQNSNDAPWTSTFPMQLAASRYPAWLTRGDMDLRPQHGVMLLQSQPRFTIAQLIDDIHSTRLIMADRVLGDLLPAARLSMDPDAQAAAVLLGGWDRTARADSRGAVLFDTWYALYAKLRVAAGKPIIYREVYDPERPLLTPMGLDDPAGAAAALAEAARQVRRQYGRLDPSWGDVHRIRMSGRSADFRLAHALSDAPASGADNPLGGLHNMRYLAAGPDGIRSALGAEGYFQAVEFTPDGVKGWMQLSYGNASRPGSPHVTDQLGDFVAGRVPTAPRSRSEVEAVTVSRETFR